MATPRGTWAISGHSSAPLFLPDIYAAGLTLQVVIKPGGVVGVGAGFPSQEGKLAS